MLNLKDLTAGTEDWAAIHRERHEFFKTQQTVPSLWLIIASVLTIAAGLYWNKRDLEIYLICTVSLLGKRNGEKSGYDIGYKHGLYAARQGGLHEESRQ